MTPPPSLMPPALPAPSAARRTTARQAGRRSQTDAKIVDATLRIVRRDGLDAITIDAVAHESGVAKTTIYRRYYDRSALLAGVALQLPAHPLGEHELSREGLESLVRDLVAVFEERIGVTALGMLLAGDQTVTRAWRDTVVTPHLEAMGAYFARGVDRAGFAREVDYALIIETIIGGLVACAALRGEVPGTWASGIVDIVWPVIAPVPGP